MVQIEIQEPNVIINGDKLTPEDRAKELINRFYAWSWCDSNESKETRKEQSINNARQIALEHCNMMIAWHKVRGQSILSTNAMIIEYFHNVKKALNEL